MRTLAARLLFIHIFHDFFYWADLPNAKLFLLFHKLRGWPAKNKFNTFLFFNPNWLGWPCPLNGHIVVHIHCCQAYLKHTNLVHLSSCLLECWLVTMLSLIACTWTCMQVIIILFKGLKQDIIIVRGLLQGLPQRPACGLQGLIKSISYFRHPSK